MQNERIVRAGLKALGFPWEVVIEGSRPFLATEKAQRYLLTSQNMDRISDAYGRNQMLDYPSWKSMRNDIERMGNKLEAIEATMSKEDKQAINDFYQVEIFID